MRLKGSDPFFQRSMSNMVLAELVYQICELYIDDVLILGRGLESFLHNVRKVFERLLVHLLVHSFIHSYIPSFVHSLLIHTLSRSCIQ